MAVSDTYVVQYLLQATLDQPPSAVWNEAGGSYRTELRGVKIELDIVPSRAGDRVYLNLTLEDSRVWIAEPADTGLLGPQYPSGAETLASLLRHLARAVLRQCSAREDRMRQSDDASRERVLARLLYDSNADLPDTGQPPSTRWSPAP